LKLLFQPDQTDVDGNVLAVPKSLSHFITSWSNTTYAETDCGYVLLQEFIAKKFSIYLWRIHADESMTLYPFSEKPILALQFMLLGNLPCILSGYGEKLLEQSKSELFYVPVGVNQALAAPGEYESLHIEIEPQYLDDIDEAYPAVKVLLKKLRDASDEGTPLHPVRIGYISRAIIHDLRLTKKTGADLLVEMNVSIVGLLSAYISAVQEQEIDRVRKNVPHKQKLIDIKEEIVVNPHIHRQNLIALSKKYGLSITELKKNFKKLFDETPGEFVRRHALNKAKYLLTTTTRTIDDISDEVGYNYRINFDRAFLKQFGIQPSLLRSNRK